MATYKKEIELTRVNVNLPTNLVERIKEYSIKMGLTTTSAYIVLLNKGLDQNNALDIFSNFFELMKEQQKIENENNITSN